MVGLRHQHYRPILHRRMHPSLELIGADYWEGSTIQGHALAAAIMLAQLKQSGLALRGAAATELQAQANSLPADMPRFWE